MATDSPQEHPAWLNAFPALKAMEPSVYAEVIPNARLVTLPAKTAVFRMGAPCRNYLLVWEGVFRAHKVDESGRDITFYRAEGGNSCLLTTTALLSQSPYAAEGIVESEARIVIIPANRFLKAIAQSESFRNFALADYGRQLSELFIRMDSLLIRRDDLKIFRLLQSLHQNGEKIPASIQELARRLQLPEHIIRVVLADLEKAAIIRKSSDSGSLQIPDIKLLEQKLSG